jgi:hypothetical protein
MGRAGAAEDRGPSLERRLLSRHPYLDTRLSDRVETDRGPATVVPHREWCALHLGSHNELSKVANGGLPPPSWRDRLLRRPHPTRPDVEVETAILEAILARSGLSVRDLIDRAG